MLYEHILHETRTDYGKYFKWTCSTTMIILVCSTYSSALRYVTLALMSSFITTIGKYFNGHILNINYFPQSIGLG